MDKAQTAQTATATPDKSQRITRAEARDAILLQLRKWREDGQDMIYFGCLNIAPDLDDEITFGDLIDIVFDTPPWKNGVSQCEHGHYVIRGDKSECVDCGKEF